VEQDFVAVWSYVAGKANALQLLARLEGYPQSDLYCMKLGATEAGTPNDALP